MSVHLGAGVVVLEAVQVDQDRRLAAPVDMRVVGLLMESLPVVHTVMCKAAVEAKAVVAVAVPSLGWVVQALLETQVHQDNPAQVEILALTERKAQDAQDAQDQQDALVVLAIQALQAT